MHTNELKMIELMRKAEAATTHKKAKKVLKKVKKLEQKMAP